MDLNLTQNQVAKIIGVTESSVWNWESNESSPFWRYWGPIWDFLGYSPFPPGQTLAEKLVMNRKLLGLSQEESARRLGVDPTTLARWERKGGLPGKQFVERVERYLAEFERAASKSDATASSHG